MQLNHCGMLEKNKFAPLFLPQKKRSGSIDNIMLTDDPNTSTSDDEISATMIPGCKISAHVLENLVVYFIL